MKLSVRKRRYAPRSKKMKSPGEKKRASVGSDSCTPKPKRRKVHIVESDEEETGFIPVNGEFSSYLFV